MATDWKPGDRFTFEYEVESVDSGWVYTPDHRAISPHEMARAVKLPPKERPVRKGDEIVHHNSGSSGSYFYIATLFGNRYATKGGKVATSLVGDDWTHADGAPISWEDSE